MTDLISCAICLEPLTKDNKMLPCQHTYHSQCLLAYIAMAESNRIKCPECREDHIINNFNSLRANRWFINIFAPLSRQEEEEAKERRIQELVQQRLQEEMGRLKYQQLTQQQEKKQIKEQQQLLNQAQRQLEVQRRMQERKQKRLQALEQKINQEQKRLQEQHQILLRKEEQFKECVTCRVTNDSRE